MKYNSESEYLDELQKTLEGAGYKVWREVIPDECLQWDKPKRVDLVFWHPQKGYIAVEGKNVNSLRQGSIFANAIKQILEYKNFKYSGLTIDKWCVSIPRDSYFYRNNETLSEVNFFINTFLKKMYNVSQINGLTIDACTQDVFKIQETDKGYDYPKELNQYNESDYDINENKKCYFCGYDLDVEDVIIETKCPSCGGILR